MIIIIIIVIVVINSSNSKHAEVRHGDLLQEQRLPPPLQDPEARVEEGDLVLALIVCILLVV